MSFSLVLLAYGCATALAFLLLYRYEPVHWALHVLSLIAAMALDFVRLPQNLSGPEGTVFTGTIFLFLFCWGAFAPFFYKWHYRRHDEDHSAHHKA